VADTSTYPLKLDKVLLKKAKRQAENEQRTLASLIRFLLVQYLEGK
jgi:hypothetical protein